MMAWDLTEIGSDHPRAQGELPHQPKEDFLSCRAERKPHLATGNLRLLLARPPEPVGCLAPSDVIVRERLGGLLRHYERRLA